MDGVLLVGVGAVGTALAHVFASHGLEERNIHLFVRKKRVQALKDSGPKSLYSITQGKLVQVNCNKMHVVSDPSELKGCGVKLIVVTLPGNVVGSEEGQSLLKQIDEATGRKSVFLGLQPSIDGFKVYREEIDIPAERLVIGAFQLLSYPAAQAFAGEPEEAKAGAEYSFQLLRKDAPFIVASSSRNAVNEVQAFLKPYGLNASELSLSLFKVTGNIVFPLFVGLEIEGWKGLSFGKTSRLVAGSMSEIMYYHYVADGLGSGMALSYMVGSLFVLLVQRMNVRLHAPIDFYKFARFHHGGKVLTQDITVIEQYIKAGEARGVKMSRCRELLERVSTVRKAQH